ncbi:protein OSB1, mitochondrial-like [Rosa rugosa]|uniref:protein OSB1, mitochondrial-like n=1 Tax=Rosa rugosa TaxID=74645 RepID=UPI002B40E3C9|nr:protein OSB1, mitochondrial-like [Rosa rugosa]
MREVLGKPRRLQTPDHHHMKAFRLLFPPKPPLFIQRLTAYSSSAANPRFSDSFFEDEEGSGVYQHKLKFQRPTTIQRRQNPGPVNSASFIGSVILPLRVANTGHGGRFGVHTLLSVRNCPQSDSSFRILLKMWDEMAVLSFKHLKPNDFIYVSGHLGSYTKNDPDGRITLYHELVVQELNYVAQNGPGPRSENHEEPQSDAGETGLEKCRERLHLWQVFFANPYDWWDNRKTKLNSRRPDFKHKYMDEALWLTQDDPPWIKKQIHRLDLRMAEQGHGEQVGQHRRISKWEYDE